MDYTVKITLSGPDGRIREELFEGESPQDLAMLGAAKGWLEGLYKEAEPKAMAAGLVGPMKELYAEMNKPRPFPPMPPELAERLEKPLAAPEAEPS